MLELTLLPRLRGVNCVKMFKGRCQEGDKNANLVGWFTVDSCVIAFHLGLVLVNRCSEGRGT